MPQYMLLLGGTDQKMAIAAGAATMQKFGEWTDLLVKQKKLRESHKLKDREGRTLRWSSNKITDGPFSETKETVGGYYIIEAKDYDEAASVAKGCPMLSVLGGFVEIREVEI